jgi:hypothetical protein
MELVLDRDEMEESHSLRQKLEPSQVHCIFTSNPKFKTVQVQFIIFSVEQQPQHAAVAGEHQNTILTTSSQIRSGRLTLPSSLISHRSP